ncbi:MAG: ABC transporter permease [Acidobacteria bacterium]|nr:ABC transporter permease [Acidobacteriota bacterium]
MNLRLAAAFLKRDFKNQANYRVSLVLQLFGATLSMAILFFASRLFSADLAPQLRPYRADYFTFVLLGLAFHQYLGVTLYGFSGCVRQAQALGVLESMLVSPTPPWKIVVYSNLWNLTLVTLQVFLSLVVAVALFDAVFPQVNVVSAAVIFVLTLLALLPFGLISAGALLAFRRGDPISFAIASFSGLLGGVYYPVSILPDWLQHLSQIIPVTHAIEGIRQAMLKGAGLGDLKVPLLVLALTAAAGFPLAALFFNYALRKARREGSLTYQ